VAYADLYRTPGGAFFSQERIFGKDRDGESMNHNRFIPMTAIEAQEWILKGDVELEDDSFLSAPEATAEAAEEVDVSATIYVRAPGSFKRRVERAAEEAKLSVNAYTLRCLEQYLPKPIPPRPAYLGAYTPNTEGFPDRPFLHEAD
jgi:predicted HicB family RNase H-like nuclease